MIKLFEFYLISSVQTTPKYILANYILFQVISELLPYMPESFLQFRRPLMAYLKEITEEEP